MTAGKMFFCFLAFFIVAGIVQVSAQNDTGTLGGQVPRVLEYSLRLVDAHGTPLQDVLVHVELVPLPNGVVQISDRYASGGVMSLRLVEGVYDAQFFSRAPDDEFSTGYAHQRIDTTLLLLNDTITVIPIAQVRGTVVDQYQNLIPNAQLKFDCNPGSFANVDRTDAFGSFSLAAVALGECRIYAMQGTSTGSTDIVLNQSRIYDVQILLQQKIIPQNDSLWWARIAIGVGIVILVLVIYFITRGPSWSKRSVVQEQKTEQHESKKAKVRSRLKRHPKQKQQETTRIEDNERLQAVLKTLDGYDREIVETLMKNNGIMTQNKIRYATSIPKTSLFRCIQRLEHRRIVKTESVGKMKTVILEEFSS